MFPVAACDADRNSFPYRKHCTKNHFLEKSPSHVMHFDDVIYVDKFNA